MIKKEMMLIVCAISCIGTVFADTEEDIALFPGAENRIYNIGASRRMRKYPKERISALRKFIQNYPDTDFAPKAATMIISALQSLKKYNEVLRESEAFLKTYPRYRSKCLGIASNLTRMVGNKKLPADIRKRAFEILRPNVKGIGFHCAGLRNWLFACEDLSPKQKFEIMLEISPQAGNGLDAGGTAWFFASKYIAALSNAPAKIAVCEKYIKTFPNNSWLTNEARQRLLSLKAATGDADAKKTLSELKKRKSAWSRALRQMFKTAKELLEREQYDSALKELEKLKGMDIPKYATTNYWNQLGATFKQLPPEVVLKLFKLACETSDDGFNNYYLDRFADPALYATPELADKIIALFNTYFSTFTVSDMRANHIIKFTRNRLGRTVSGETRMKLFATLAKVAKKHGLNNLRSQYLYTAGIALLGENPKKALAYFQQAAKTGMPNKRVAQSKWLCELLEGRRSLIHPPSPRFLPERLSFKVAPEMKITESNIPSKVEIVEKDGKFSLSPQKTKIEFLSAKSSETARNASAILLNGKKENAWIPRKLPATLLVPLKRVSTISRLQINTDYGFEYTISLVDEKNRVLRRFERKRLKIYTENIAPQPIAKLEFLPCDNVAGILIKAYDRVGDADGINKLQASGPKFTLRALKILAPKPLPSAKKILKLSYETKYERMEVKYDGVLARFFRRQWVDPWRTYKYFRMSGLDFSFSIYGGENLTLNFALEGAVNWMMDGRLKGRVENKDKDKSAILVSKPSDGLHLLNFSGSSLPVGNDTFGANSMQFKGLSVTGEAKGFYIVRFKLSKGWRKWFGAKDVWSEWRRGNSVRVPENAVEYQLAAVLDSRGVLGGKTAVLGTATVSFTKVGEADDTAYSLKECGFIRDDVDELVNYIKKHRPVIAYSKNGTKAEYEAAKKLAEKAGCYLISDDVEFNNRREKGPILAVGTPLINRYCRSLISRLSVWNDENFLNSASGFAAPPPNSLEPDTNFAFITGETVDSVLNALRRVTAAVPSFKPESDFELFAAPLLERVYPWQLHQGAPEIEKLSIELALNDRRSVKAGITFNHSADKFKVVCDPLKSASGITLPPPRIRYTGYYEWSFFFGDVRVPDLLVDKPVLPIPSNTATCVWLTVDTNERTLPGTYHSKVRFIDGDVIREVPFEVRVLNLKIPNKIITSYDYAGVPYWFTPNSPAFWRVFRKLTADQAKHGVNKIKIYDNGECALRNGKVVFDFSFPLKQMRVAEKIFKKMRKGIPDFYYPAPNLTHQAFTLYPKRDAKTVYNLRVEYARQLAAALKKRGLWERVWLKVGDEPGDMEQWVATARPYKKGGMKVWTTSGKKEMSEVTDAWSPVYSHNLNTPILISEKKKGIRPVWWYTCAGGGPGMWITGEMANVLPIYWLTAKWDFAGVDNNAAMGIGPAFGFPYRYNNGNEHRILITPDEEIIDTDRREIESDGLYDARLAYLIKDGISALRKAGNIKKADKLKKSFDAIMLSVVPYKWGYAMEPKKWDDARRALYALAAKIAN